MGFLHFFLQEPAGLFSIFYLHCFDYQAIYLKKMCASFLGNTGVAAKLHLFITYMSNQALRNGLSVGFSILLS